MILAEGKCTKNPKEQTHPSDATKTKQGAAHRATPCFLWDFAIQLLLRSE